MHLTLHITNKCNLRCKYCYVQKGSETMARKTAFAAVDLAAGEKKPCGLIFFGGEPLIERELIYDTVKYSQKIKKETGQAFYYKVTTNGTLLDEDFLKFSRGINMMIGFSHDGRMQDDFRLFANGAKTAKILEEKIPLLLYYQPYAIAMCTVNPKTAPKLASSVEWLMEKGFGYIAVSPNYDKSANWDDKSFAALESEYKKLAQLYIKWTLEDKKFYLSCFEMKIMSHIKGGKYCEDRCQLGRRQVSVAPDGGLYPCVQFINDAEYEMGDVFSGVDANKRKIIEQKGSVKSPVCESCAVNKRCNHTCGCLNRQATGSIGLVSPVQCAHERMLLPIADFIAETLYKKRNSSFLHKHYNEFYPILSLVEDKSALSPPDTP
ncbi:MAG: SPASM domain-containing protein [Oscillospiraceae bacterium]|nr:SPASM domain-containing protein [Oscillospiraceae bacterium]